WTALANSDQVMAVGYQPDDEVPGVEDRLHHTDIRASRWRDARQQVLDIILRHERQNNPGLSERDLLAFEENPVLPVLDVRLSNPATVTALRQSKLVRYAEPMGYEPFQADRVKERSSSGCGSNTAQTDLQLNIDYTNIQPGCKQSWNHPFHKITEAWNAGNTGSGTTVCIIDTGCSEDQENLGEALNQGYSSGRSMEKYVTLPGASSPDDLCGHGTSMLGACAAPRGTDGAAAGIAYNADLVAFRAAEDVYLDASAEVTGVSNAFTQAGNNTNVRIISLSMGRIISSSQISDAIKYAYGKGKMIFAAAGTSFSWTAWFTGVIFPASMAECVAVTGIKDNLTQRCAACHVGSKVDFVLVMEKASTGRHALSLAQSGDVPSTVGGSSVSTSSTAGIAALVWAKYPGWTRQQVFDRLKTSGSYWPTRNGSFGWGRIDAQKATL
ncbi:MAG TPA: S8/S53 family peptidase, partial [Saprospiraceae bacterium]|nr:S8/S53 family peptidase [Saprospiraceae bacterium]